MNNNRDFHVLIGKYVSGTLSKKEVEDLLHLIEEKPEIADQIRRNFYTDFLLSRKFTIDRETQDVFNSSFDKDFINGSPFFSFGVPEDYVPWEKEEVEPIRFSLPEEPPKRNLFVRILKKWFEYDKKKRERSFRTKPMVYGKKANSFLLIWMIFFTSFIVWLTLNGPGTKEKKDHPGFVSMGQVLNLVDVDWSQSSVKYKKGQLLETGRFSLNKGIMKIRLVNGEELYLEGPGDYLFVDQNCCYCDQGKISAHIPPNAKGFKITTPFGTFIDRGTEFYLDIDKSNAQMGVIKGMVDFVFEKKDPRSLVQGKEIQLREDRPLVITDSDPNRLMDNVRFLPVLADYTAREKKRQKEKEILWNTDPNLLVYFDLDQEGESAVPNIASRGKDLIPQGRLIGTVSVEGSFGGTKARAFSRGSSIQTTVPGKYRNLTLMANIKIERLPNAANVLFCGENIDFQPGIFLWQITQDNFLQLQISREDSKIHQIFESPICFSRKNWGTWVNVAVVIDADRKMISHYLDGDQIASAPWTSSSDLIMGNAMIGNAVRRIMKNEYHLGCPMNRFMIFDKALSKSEIKQYLTD